MYQDPYSLNHSSASPEDFSGRGSEQGEGVGGEREGGGGGGWNSVRQQEEAEKERARWVGGGSGGGQGGKVSPQGRRLSSDDSLFRSQPKPLPPSSPEPRGGAEVCASACESARISLSLCVCVRARA